MSAQMHVPFWLLYYVRFRSAKITSKKRSHPGIIYYGPTEIILETLNEIVLIAHIEGHFKQERASLTKCELECMLDGYPPWYREKFITVGNLEVPFPIHFHEDIPRAGWVIAVGLMGKGWDSKLQKPLALYRCPNEPEDLSFRQNGRMFQEAIKRCCDHIQKNH